MQNGSIFVWFLNGAAILSKNIRNPDEKSGFGMIPGMVGIQILLV